MRSDRATPPPEPPFLGGVIHTYQGYDPKAFPSPTKPPPDMVSGAFDHWLAFGSTRRLTEEELARAIRLDPSQIKGLGPTIDGLIAMLEERKRKILARFETKAVERTARRVFHDHAASMRPPPALERTFRDEVQEEQLRDLERLWYRVEHDDPPFAAELVQLVEELGEKYQVDELVATYTFTGREPMTVPQALKVKAELERIDELLEQLREARESAQIAVIDMEAMSEFAEPGDLEQLSALQQMVQDYLRETAEQQGIEFTREGYQITPKAMRIFQSRLLEHIFNDLQAARSGRHLGPIEGDGAVEMPSTRPYEFGDSIAHMDASQSIINALVRRSSRSPSTDRRLRVDAEDIEIHQTRNTPKCATAVVMDMSGSMRYNGLYVACKRMGLALDGLIRREYPGDFLQFIEMYSFGKPRRIAEVPSLMPKPVTIYEPVVRLRADMSDPRISELDIPPHFTNIQHSLQLARQILGVQDTPNRQIILITDGLPTAHFEGEELFLLYPPDPRTEEATMREAHRCAQEGMTINIFLLPNWSQSREDVQFAQRMVEATEGRVFFTGGRDLDRFVLWDYVKRRRTIIG
ncbi:MAG: hypothetical protein HKO59_15530 [Phycisphaerales bacterium]|nr:hypothetical protein [Phycisphaerae bacterium]NNF41942.1 hypothetical protein [Phycisphaerales bacterium]NNM27366.1 hypothetical protein [Phycisphaerales bacterium]